MNRDVLSPEEGAELKRLLQEHKEIEARARAILVEHGMDSPQFKEADAAVTKLWSRIRQLQGMGGKSWNA